jgi:hypothetical protein
MTKRPQMVGDMFGDALVWHWNRSLMQYETEHDGTKLHVYFHKIGGRWSRTLPSGKENESAGRSYWTILMQPQGVYAERPSTRYADADAAKEAVAEMYRRYLRGRAVLNQGAR